MMSRTIVLLSILVLFGGVPNAHAEACMTATAVPASLTRLATGSATATREGESVVSGGQTLYVTVKNANVLGVSMTVKISRNVIPATELCTISVILLPQMTRIYHTSFFGEPPLSWKVEVSVGPESDAGVLTYEVYSQRPASNNR